MESQQFTFALNNDNMTLLRTQNPEEVGPQIVDCFLTAVDQHFGGHHMMFESPDLRCFLSTVFNNTLVTTSTYATRCARPQQFNVAADEQNDTKLCVINAVLKYLADNVLCLSQIALDCEGRGLNAKDWVGIVMHERPCDLSAPLSRDNTLGAMLMIVNKQNSGGDMVFVINYC